MRKSLGVTCGHPDPKIGPQVYLGPIKMTILGHISPTKHPWKMESCVFTFVVSLNPENTTQPSTQHTSSIDPQVRPQSTFSPACLLTKVPGAPSANVTSVDVPENEYTQLHNKCNYTNDLFEKKPVAVFVCYKENHFCRPNTQYAKPLLTILL